MKDYIVVESRRRSFLKAISFRVIEIALSTIIMSFFIDARIALGLSFANEGTCFLVHFIFERVWNKIDYGREVRFSNGRGKARL